MCYGMSSLGAKATRLPLKIIRTEYMYSVTSHASTLSRKCAYKSDFLKTKFSLRKDRSTYAIPTIFMASHASQDEYRQKQ